MSETLLDLTGLKCPLPALKTKRALQSLADGDELLVIATDPLASIDIPNAVREAGADLRAQTIGDDGSMTFRVVCRASAQT